LIAPVENSDIVLNGDIAPTLIDFAGAEIPPEMQDRSLVPLLKGDNNDLANHFWS
jgi:arylsulfatase A-like enzyme